MCTSRCGVIATVKDGRLTQVNADPDHPNGCICVKGTAAPEIVYSSDRLQYPMVRTRPKGDADPGWVRLSWEQALDLVVLRLSDIKDNDGAESVVFSRSTSAGTASIDFDGWFQRLANAFGSPNILGSHHICTWNRTTGSKYTFGSGMPTPDFDRTRCMLLWGVNPTATSPAQAARITRARNRSAKLIVIDPRKTNLAAKADCWLPVRPGKDGELGMAMIHVLIEENLYDADFVRQWTNAPFLVRGDNQQLLTERDIVSAGDPQTFFVRDEESGKLVSHRANRGAGFPTHVDDADRNVRAPSGLETASAKTALFGSSVVALADGRIVDCHPVFELLKERAAQFAPERSESITWVAPQEVRRAARLFATEKPSSYCTWVGLEQHSNAAQMNRAVCCFYALTGQFDQPGSNILMAATPTHNIIGNEFLSKQQAGRRLGAAVYPLGPQNDPGLVEACDVYDAILTGEPYPIKAMVLFGSDPLLEHGDSQHGKKALEALDFYVHMDMLLNPSATLADVILPAATCWEREALVPSFNIAQETANWAQLKPAVAAPLYESRSDLEIIFELAQRLGLGEHFFNGDLEAAWNYQLKPSGLTIEKLRANRGGIGVASTTRYRKFAEIDPSSGAPRGFVTPTGKLEIYSTKFAEFGYPALPSFAAGPGNNQEYPLVLTFYRVVQFCDEHHRNIARLRRRVPEPCLEIHPRTASARGITDGEWINLESALASVRMKAKFNGSLHPNVVVTQYGWWQECKELGLPGQDPFSSNGSNVNRIIPNANIDPIGGSVPHRSQECRVSKLSE
jgi:anaerobic selenocysteine-containing dehydrogenase